MLTTCPLAEPAMRQDGIADPGSSVECFGSVRTFFLRSTRRPLWASKSVSTISVDAGRIGHGEKEGAAQERVENHKASLGFDLQLTQCSADYRRRHRDRSG